MSDSLRPHESQHTRPPCPSPTPRVYSNSCPSSQWCHPDISSSVIPFSSCPQSLQASGSFPMSQLLAWSGQSIGVYASASVLPMNTQDWSPFGWTVWISLQSKGLSRVFSNTTVQKHQLFGTQFSSPGSLDAKESGDNARDPGLIPVSGRSPREGNGYPLSYSCLENSRQRSLVGYGLWGLKESDMTASKTFSFYVHLL